MSEENWKPVVGYEDSYEVSDHGRVRCLYREKEFMARWGMARMRFPAKDMKVFATSKGYLYVGLSKDAQSKKHLIHRLVIAAFVGESSMEVNHKDGNKSNNHISNLEYCTSSENNLHRGRVLGKVIGSSQTRAVLTEKDIPAIRADTRKLKDIAADYGVTLQAIWYVKKRKNWSHIE